MKSLLARLLLIAGAALSLVNVGAEGCGLGSAAQGCPGGTCPSGSPDAGFGLADMGQGGGSADLGANFGDSISMKVPKPLQSLVDVNTSLEFEVGVGTSTAAAYEPNITITEYSPSNPDMGAAPVAGAFSWKQPTSGGPAQLTFIPNAPLSDNTDYVVHVLGPSSGHYVLKTGFSTGSRPRVSALALQISTGPSVAVTISFSEPMDSATLSGRITLLSGTTTLSTSLSSSASGDAVVQVTNPAKIGSSLTVRVDGNVISAAPTPPGPAPMVSGNDWDTVPSTFVSGGFQWTFTGVSTSGPSTQTWAPTVD